ncbi:hypothetical protein [Flammeovirga sp. OC4]|uniref:hypothetical protein n=1 Tax=Flammeovirga sp. OC4 TaxID=1382345 RepID=UPI0005C5E972|nr:hypothetical protein [Flammeovirga sp. OC4]
MTKKLYFAIFLLVTLLTGSCDIFNKCEDVACFTPPQPFNFQLIDADSNEDLFINGTYDSQLFSVETDDDLEFNGENLTDQYIITTGSIGWKTQKVSFKFLYDGETLCTITVDAERKSGDCCSYTEINDFNVEGVNYELIRSKDIYQLKIPIVQ